MLAAGVIAAGAGGHLGLRASVHRHNAVEATTLATAVSACSRDLGRIQPPFPNAPVDATTYVTNLAIANIEEWRGGVPQNVRSALRPTLDQAKAALDLLERVQASREPASRDKLIRASNHAIEAMRTSAKAAKAQLHARAEREHRRSSTAGSWGRILLAGGMIAAGVAVRRAEPTPRWRTRER